jgi:hypothetical protein
MGVGGGGGLVSIYLVSTKFYIKDYVVAYVIWFYDKCLEHGSVFCLRIYVLHLGDPAF